MEEKLSRSEIVRLFHLEEVDKKKTNIANHCIKRMSYGPLMANFE